MDKKLITVAELANILKITPEAIYMKLQRFVFPKDTYFRLGRRIYFREEKLINWFEGVA